MDEGRTAAADGITLTRPVDDRLAPVVSADALAFVARLHREFNPKREALLGLLQRGVARGEVRPEAADELVAEVLPAMLLTRLVVQGLPVSDEHIERIVDNIVMPLLRPA